MLNHDRVGEVPAVVSAASMITAHHWSHTTSTVIGQYKLASYEWLLQLILQLGMHAQLVNLYYTDSYRLRNQKVGGTRNMVSGSYIITTSIKVIYRQHAQTRDVNTRQIQY